MNQNSIIKMALPLVLALASIYLVIDLLTSGGNAIAQLYRYCFFGAAVFGLLSPRTGFFLLIFLTAYLDFLKRLMIFDSGVQQMDLYFILGMAPALLSGIACSILYSLLTSKSENTGVNVKFAFLVLMVCLGIGAVGVSASSGLRGAADVVNGIVYIPVLFVVPCLFRTPAEVRSMLRGLVIIYIPAVLYMLVHWSRSVFFDLNPSIFDWELDYIKSGLTIEVRQLGELVFRPFGTFNSAANASMIFAMVFGLLWSRLWGINTQAGSTLRFIRIILIPLILIAMFATYSRTGWFFLIGVVLAPKLFRGRLSTLAFYSCSIAMLVTLILASPYMIKNNTLKKWTNELGTLSGNDKWLQATNVATMSSRLYGFDALMNNRNIWTPFGFRFQYSDPQAAMDKVSTHDAITRGLMKFGFVPIIILGFIGFFMAKSLHRYVYSETDPLAKFLSSTCLGLGVVLVAGGTVNFAQFFTFPVNFWIFLMFGCVISLKIWSEQIHQDELKLSRSVILPPGIRKARTSFGPLATNRTG